MIAYKNKIQIHNTRHKLYAYKVLGKITRTYRSLKTG